MKIFMVAFVVAALGACVEEEEGSPTMRPGEDCMNCHGAGGEPQFSVAGTVFTASDAPASGGMSDATIVIEDAAGQVLRLTSNRAGNFYSRAKAAFPIKASIERNGTTISMVSTVTSGSCGSCHEAPGSPGRVFMTP